MKDTISILNVELDNKTAKEAMQAVLQYIETEQISTIDFITLDMLMQNQEDIEWTEAIHSFDMVLPAGRDILEAAELTDARGIQPNAAPLFLQMFLKYLQRNRKRLFLLAETAEELQVLSAGVRKRNRGIIVVGEELFFAGADSAEMIINNINGAEVDCVLSILPSPLQEMFIVKNYALLNARIWLGCGKAMNTKYNEKMYYGRIKHYFVRKIFRHQVGKQKRENEHA